MIEPGTNLIVTETIVSHWRSGLVKAGISLFILILVYAIGHLFIRRQVEHKKQRKKYQVRLRYSLGFLFILALAKIWVEGFSHLLAFLGLIAAALTITQKESLMNLFGWLIIVWRDLFVEGDYVQIEEHNGYVESIRLLYFTLREISPEPPNAFSGKTVKIPNGMLISHLIVNYSKESTMLSKTVSFIFAPQSSLEKIQMISDNLRDCLVDFYQSKKEYLRPYLEKHISRPLKHFPLNPQIYLRCKFDAPSGYHLLMQFYAYKIDLTDIENQLTVTILKIVQTDPDVILRFDEK